MEYSLCLGYIQVQIQVHVAAKKIRSFVWIWRGLIFAVGIVPSNLMSMAALLVYYANTIPSLGVRRGSVAWYIFLRGA